MPLRDWLTPTVLRRGETLQLRVGALDTEEVADVRRRSCLSPEGADGGHDSHHGARAASRYYSCFKEAVKGIAPKDGFTLNGERIRGALEHKPSASPPHSLRHDGITYWLDQG